MCEGEVVDKKEPAGSCHIFIDWKKDTKMDSRKYEENKKLLQANTDLFKGLNGKADGAPDFVISMLNLVYEMGVTATKENTEYECRNSVLSKMAESVTKEG